MKSKRRTIEREKREERATNEEKGFPVSPLSFLVSFHSLNNSDFFRQSRGVFQEHKPTARSKNVQAPFQLYDVVNHGTL